MAKKESEEISMMNVIEDTKKRDEFSVNELKTISIALDNHFKKWLSLPLPIIKSGKNKGKEKWDKVVSELSPHIYTEKTIDNEFVLSLFGDSYKKVNLSSNLIDELIKVFSSKKKIQLLKLTLSIMENYNGTSSDKLQSPI